MRMRRIDSVFWSWMVIAVFLAAVASPAAMPPGRSIDSWNSICTSSGAVAVGEAEGAPSLPANSHPFGHCPICALHGALLGLPAQAGYALALLPLAFAIPRLVLAAPPASHGWLPAQPRGPPIGD